MKVCESQQKKNFSTNTAESLKFQTRFNELLEKRLMVFIVAASSVDHALDTLNPENRKTYNKKIFSIPGLSLNPNTKNPRKIVQNLLWKDLSEKTDIVIWHDVLNNSLSKHESNNFRPLTNRFATARYFEIFRKQTSSSVLPPIPYP